MVSSLPSDALRDPHRVLQDFYQKSKDDGQDFSAKVASYFADIFKDALNEIPVMDTSTPPHIYKESSLVAFRAMIQDTLPPTEMYLSKLSSGACGGWGATEEASTTSALDYNDLKESSVMWAVSIPGRSVWSDLEGSEASASSHKSSRPHKYPLHAEPHVGMQLKIYDTSKAEALKSTDIHDFIGILTSESLQVADMDPAATPPLVPTLHVLFSQPLPPTIIPRVFPYAPSSSSVQDLRSELVSWLADEALGGDRFAAEWVLLCAMAKVQSRNPPILPPSLTLSRFPAPPPGSTNLPTLRHALSLLFPSVSAIPLSLETINTTQFAPESRDEDLVSGWLQLPKGSVCLITEGGLSEGGVTERGLRNLHATQEMMKDQVLNYVFPFSNFGFETDVSFVVLAEGRKSTFFNQTTVNVPFAPPSGEQLPPDALYKPADAIKLPDPDKLEAFRALVGGAMVGTAKVGEEAAEHIENEFVKERQAAKMTSDDLILRMLLARLVALSYHVPEVSVDIWNKARALELERKAREAAAAPGSKQ
ncbi:hypothetical protein BD626DRAFT_462490 [Schizophyllum amplum]|uniref:Mini-chromosome maintenance replisome factor-domain-containing protein n=1 Tax=Schizophyllum amplum TaxID=97359 RepID=A0A550C3Q4_9AGAR|nr:hypothetical protein BD626DRAFT_462490 [Auriculariopsis ampla]